MVTINALRIVIDDLRDLPVPGALYARTSEEGLTVLRHATETGAFIEELWLDHDLGEVDGVLDDIGIVVTWLEEHAYFGTGPRIGTVYVHTSNPVGAATICRALSRFFDVRRVNVLEL